MLAHGEKSNENVIIKCCVCFVDLFCGETPAGWLRHKYPELAPEGGDDWDVEGIYIYFKKITKKKKKKQDTSSWKMTIIKGIMWFHDDM